MLGDAPVGGGGLVSGIRTAIGTRLRGSRSSPRQHRGTRRARARRADAGHPDVDRRRPEAPFAGALALQICAPTSNACSSRSKRSRTLSVPLRARQARVNRPLRQPLRRGGGQDPGRAAGRRCLGRERRHANRHGDPGPAVKSQHSPRVVLATVHCSCGDTFTTRSTRPELHVGDLLELPPVLHRQAEARRHGRWVERSSAGSKRPSAPRARSCLTAMSRPSAARLCSRA